MRVFAGLLLVVCAAQAQFKSNVPLVVAPTTITDAKGRYVDGLTEDDLLLYDNNVRQPIHLDYSEYPISLVVAVQSGPEAHAVLLKLGGSGIMFSQLVAAEGGETAVISFSDEVRIHNEFTRGADKVMESLRSVPVEGDGACTLDAMMRALKMLGARRPERRRIIFVIAEKRDRDSVTKLPEVMREVQRQNASVYWLTFSPSLTPFTMKPETVKSKDSRLDGQLIPYEAGPMNILAIFGELGHLAQPNLAELFAHATGGSTMNFLEKKGLEEEIHAMGEDVHRQYIVSFQPPSSQSGKFHALRVEVKGRPDLKTKTRDGYWAVE